ncbi:hydrolase [Proteus mirabilis]|uniref:Hydrolase n=1 Tax=Proteus mirabilis TaxID=584 RepID=A0A2X2BY58_PROMI|nr:hydrolase [Proteus mirabilis]
MSQYFDPIPWAKNPHLQTLLPRIVRRTPLLTPYWQRLNLPDNDFVDLAWSEEPKTAQHKPRLVIFHGLEGNFNSPYVHGMLAAAKSARMARCCHAFSRLQWRTQSAKTHLSFW